MEKPEKKRDLPQTFDSSGASKCFYNQLAQEVCDRLIECSDISTFDGLVDASREIHGCDN
jgi:hypothetical protein